MNFFIVNSNGLKVEKKAIREKAEATGWKIIAMEIMPDHIHIFLQAENRTSSSEVVRHLKGHSRILGLEFPRLRARGHIWASRKNNTIRI